MNNSTDYHESFKKGVSDTWMDSVSGGPQEKGPGLATLLSWDS